MKMQKDAEGPSMGTIRGGRCAVQERWMTLCVSWLADIIFLKSPQNTRSSLFQLLKYKNPFPWNMSSLGTDSQLFLNNYLQMITQSLWLALSHNIHRQSQTSLFLWTFCYFIHAFTICQVPTIGRVWCCPPGMQSWIRHDPEPPEAYSEW